MNYAFFDNFDTITPDVFSHLLSEISEQRRGKVLRYKFESGRVQSLMAYVTLKKLLKEHYNISASPIFKEGEHGKPEIEKLENEEHSGAFPFISMSHCKAGVACAVNDKPVGIDIETIQTNLKYDLCNYVFNEKEAELINTSEKPCVEFTRLWTVKESIVKLIGTGIEGKNQLQGILNDAQDYVFHTEINEQKGWVMTVCEYR